MIFSIQRLFPLFFQNQSNSPASIHAAIYLNFPNVPVCHYSSSPHISTNQPYALLFLTVQIITAAAFPATRARLNSPIPGNFTQ